MRSLLALFVTWPAIALAEPAEQEWVPDDTTAVLLSRYVGFGAGHFYAENPDEGAVHATIQSFGLAIGAGGGISMALASGQVPTSEYDAGALNRQYSTAVGFIAGGVAIFLVDRLFDIARAPRSVRTWGSR